MKLRFTIITYAMLLLGAAFSAQAQMEMPKPAPELKKLDVFAGTWTMEGDMKPGPMGPGGKWTGTEHSDWMEGGYFLQGHSEFKSPMGNAKGPSFMGYDSSDKVYTYDAFNSMGEAEHAKGTVDGDTWSWTSEEKMGGQTMKGRYTVKITSPSTYDMKYEMSSDGATWNTVMEGKAKKK